MGTESMKTVYSYLHTLTTTGATILVLTDGNDRQAQGSVDHSAFDEEDDCFEVYEKDFGEPHVIDASTAVRYVAHDYVSLGDPPRC